MIKIEFPADNKELAAAIGRALCVYGGVTMPLEITADTDPLGVVVEAAIAPLDDVEAAIAPLDDVEKTESGVAEAAAPKPAAEVDINKVAFNADFCGKANEPFYAAGARAGQWKKKRGVSDEAYDAWYGGERIDAAPATTGDDPGHVDTSEAFSAEDGYDPGTSTSGPIPATCGDFMVWVSEQIASDRITQADVTAVYSANNISVQDIIPPNSEEDVAQRIAVLHAALIV